ncbi:nitrite reductase/ring-hydroxylating ferredoxin subunit [Caulobacter ginsengisoli]|uniref:Nitrite reductase/ring-hydroxylating ferredoxin subunit n=1 Tax=Caulobacter ginsengisoli TaxID=400775 RepID=A0ABU0IY05_9CAUL|nr:SRPBCC family protein [Caulobacter ginsengisoli]MDQ0466886.1 nitrite reductase/ring-hydroxylating ferredoxin subunit [Caulobacter ginsengisoli]
MSDTLEAPAQQDSDAEAMRRLERRTVAHLAAGGTTDWGPAPLTISPSEYTDPVRFEAEKRELFGKAPLLAGLSCEVANPGDVLLFDSVGPAILIVRNREGALNAFLNMCTHRAARLVSDCARRKLLVCPFHAWSFDLDGRLVAMPGEDSFETIDRTTRNLVRVPVGEWGGMVFVKAYAGEETIDVAAWLGEMGPELLRLNLAGTSLIKHSRVEVETNWKYALDTYGEGYHFGALHPTTFGTTTCSNVILFDSFGPHYRVNFTNSGYRDLVGVDEQDWPVTPYGGSHLVFPNSIVYGAPMEGGGSMIGMYRLYPGDVPGRSFTIMSTYRGADAPAGTPDAAFEGAHDYIEEVVRTEDYSVSKEGQRNLQHAPEGFRIVYGRNEIALQNTHRHVARMIGMPLD